MIEQEIRDIIREELEALRVCIIDNMTAAGQHATGKTRDSLQVEIGELSGVLKGRRAFATLERGSRRWSRPPARVPRFFADLIGEWIDAKGLDLNKWAVAHTLIHKGSKLYRTGGRSDIYSPEIEKAGKAIADRVAERYSVLITDRLIMNHTETITI